MCVNIAKQRRWVNGDLLPGMRVNGSRCFASCRLCRTATFRSSRDRLFQPIAIGLYDQGKGAGRFVAARFALKDDEFRFAWIRQAHRAGNIKARGNELPPRAR